MNLANTAIAGIPPSSAVLDLLPCTLTTAWEAVSMRFAFVNMAVETTRTAFVEGCGTYGNYLDEVWTIDNRAGGITVANLNSPTSGTAVDRHFYSNNTLYHVYGLTDESGNLIEAYQYDAYGKQTVITDGNDGDTIVNFGANDVRTVGGNSTVNNPYMYTGQRFDPETGLMYYKNRYMSTDLGRFLSRDPIGYEGGINLYEYANSEPTMRLDSYGQKSYMEFGWCIFNPICCSQGYAYEGKTGRKINKHYGQEKDGTFLNALKHCLWMCKTAATWECSCSETAALGYHHEEAGAAKNPGGKWDANNFMDNSNNLEGILCVCKLSRKCGRYKSEKKDMDWNDCIKCCEDKLKSGKLQWIQSLPAEDIEKLNQTGKDLMKSAVGAKGSPAP